MCRFSGRQACLRSCFLQHEGLEARLPDQPHWHCLECVVAAVCCQSHPSAVCAGFVQGPIARHGVSISELLHKRSALDEAEVQALIPLPLRPMLNESSKTRKRAAC